MATMQDFEAAIPALTVKDQSFALSLLSGWKRYGALTARQAPWVDKLIARAQNGAPQAVQVGNLSGVLALFDRAKRHLKFPAIVLGVPDAGVTIRVSVAGPRAKVPGSLTITSAQRVDGGDMREWFGRIRLDGTFEPGGALADNAQLRAALTARLVAFAADPAKVAADHGRLTGRCCFCNLALKDERSTAVGYGSTCAAHYGLPWGAKPRAFACEPATN